MGFGRGRERGVEKVARKAEVKGRGDVGGGGGLKAGGVG